MPTSALTTATLDAMLDYFAANEGAWLSLHDAAGTELSGGAYARQAAPWGAASGASVTTTAAVVFGVPAGSTVSYVGYNTAATAGTLGGLRLLSDAPESYTGAGLYTIPAGDLTETLEPA